MNRVDVVDLVVDLVDVGLDIDLVDVDLDVDLVDVGPVDVVPAVPSRVRVGVGVVFVLFAPQKKSRGRKGTLAAGCPLDKANGRGHKSTLGKRGLGARFGLCGHGLSRVLLRPLVFFVMPASQESYVPSGVSP